MKSAIIPDAPPDNPPAACRYRGGLPPSRTPAPDIIGLKVTFTSTSFSFELANCVCSN